MNAYKAVKLHFLLLTACTILLSAATTASAQDDNQWQLIGTMNQGRADHTAATMSDGTVILVGGFNKESESASKLYLNTTEIFNQNTGWQQWTGNTPNTPMMNVARASHTMTLMPPYPVLVNNRPKVISGKHLIVGGVNNAGAVSSYEIFDTTTKTFTKYDSLLLQARYNHAATTISSVPLQGATVVVTGGRTRDQYLDSVQVYFQGQNFWMDLPSMNYARADHTANIVSIGDIDGDGEPDQGLVVVGGRNENGPVAQAEVLVNWPELGGYQWIVLGSLVEPRYSHVAFVRDDGRLMVAGGLDAGNTPLNSTEIYLPLFGEWMSSHFPPVTVPVPDPENPDEIIWVQIDPPAQMLKSHANAPCAMVWPSDVFDGYGFLVPGGRRAAIDGERFIAAEIYDDGTNEWKPAGYLNSARRGGHTISGFIWNQQVLVAGGYVENNVTVNTGDFFPVAVPAPE